jgi:chromosome segregation ATPase
MSRLADEAMYFGAVADGVESQQEEIAELRQQLADRDEQISDLTISSDTYFAERNSARDVWRRASKDRDELRQQLAASEQDRQDQIDLTIERAEEVKQLRQQLDERDAEAGTAWAQAHRLALELECLIMDTKDNAVVSKWWDSAFEAIEEYSKLKPGAAEDAEAWAKMRKVRI